MVRTCILLDCRNDSLKNPRLLTADGRLSTGPTPDKAVCLHRGLQFLRRRTRRGRASANCMHLQWARTTETAIQFCNCLRDTYMASCFSQNKLLIVLRNVGGKCDIRSRVSCVMSAIQHFHFYVIYKLNCKIFCICKISTTKQFCTINVDIYLMRMNLRQAVQHLNAASVVCELPRLWGVVQGFPVNLMQLILVGQQPRLVAHYWIAMKQVMWDCLIIHGCG